jgi:hypothetical protein
MSKELSLEYLQTISQNDFYKNDKEFLKIIKKLTAQSASLNNKAVALVALLNEAERIKLEMVQKEIELGLSSDDKPYGKRDAKKVLNNVLVYKYAHLHLKKTIEDFIEILETYFECEDLEEKKVMLQNAKNIIDFLEKEGMDATHFIITPQRAKVWHILEHAYGKTIRKISIDFFIEKIRTTRLQHIEAVDEIIFYHKKKKENIIKLSNLLKNEIDESTQKEIDKLKKEINKELDADVAPLLIDTHKIMESLDFMIEEIPNELEESQRKELQEFIPILSEYYTDQVYALSGGNAFTSLAKNLKYIQELIDNHEPAGKILNEVNKLEFTMQHLYILHWIAESLLKEILACYDYSCSLGRTVSKYNKTYTYTKVVLETIKKAIKFRNSVAHQGVIWKPEGIKVAIESYKEYVDTVAQERQFDMNNFYLTKLDRALTLEQKKARVSNFIEQRLKVDESLIGDEIYESLLQDLQNSSWQLNNKKYRKYANKIYEHIRSEFSQKELELDYEEAETYLIEYAKKNFEVKDGEDINIQALKLFKWTCYHQNDPLKKDDVKQNIQTLKKRIEAVSDKRYKKGGLFSWMKK